MSKAKDSANAFLKKVKRKDQNKRANLVRLTK